MSYRNQVSAAMQIEDLKRVAQNLLNGNSGAVVVWEDGRVTSARQRLRTTTSGNIVMVRFIEDLQADGVIPQWSERVLARSTDELL